MQSIEDSHFLDPRDCFLAPIPEMHIASEPLSKAIDAILEMNFQLAEAFTLEEVGINNPLLRPPIHDGWDGLMRFMKYEIA